MAQVKRKTDHKDITDGSGNLTKRQQNEKAREVLALAKEVNKNRPVRYAPASDNEFRRSLILKPKKEPKLPKERVKIKIYSKEKVLSFKYTKLGQAYDSGKPVEECCELIGISRHNFRSYYDRYLIAKVAYNL
ncbi:hypothetical protein FCL53_17075 [Elizabethkingia meningoseptica]|uniref:hypothetical protein n=1 Tax=Elizabethkingia meningoseptica TaxID=238 RepID=UPI00142520D9|nr:hypothetical protein [Elizabethkingia meningoseptica]MVW93677.1 hypothetical protein [Elizabethkingia meningoseptica]